MVITLSILILITLGFSCYLLINNAVGMRIKRIERDADMERLFEAISYEYALNGQTSIYPMDASEDRTLVSINVNGKFYHYKLEGVNGVIIIRKVREDE